MELRHLRYFCAVAEALNFSRAAKRLRVAQPALSRQIKDLEDEMGVKLLRRSTTQVELTEAGRGFRQSIEKILVQIDLAVGTAQQVEKGETGKFRVGTDWLVSSSPITVATRILRERFPKVTVDFVDLPGHQHIEELRARRIDIGFAPSAFLSSPDDLVLMPLYATPMMAVLPAGHALARSKEIRLRQLKDERWLLLNDQGFPGFRTILQQIMRPAQFTPKFGRSADSLNSMIALVSSGEGVALIPGAFIREALGGIAFVPTDCLPFELCAVWLKSSPPAVGRCFYEALLAEVVKTPRLPAYTFPA